MRQKTLRENILQLDAQINEIKNKISQGDVVKENLSGQIRVLEEQINSMNEAESNFIRTEGERKEKECVSYARVWGENKFAVGVTYHQMHTDYYNEVGKKYGLQRGDDIAMLPAEEQRSRVHKNKAVLEAERQAKDAIVNAKAENERLATYRLVEG